MTHQPSFRAQLITRRTYNRPLNDAGTAFETWDMTVDRVMMHQAWLWARAKGGDGNDPFSVLTQDELNELLELKQLMLDRKVSVSGRTLWLGGTEVAKSREASQFNCSFTQVRNVFDVVDAFWLLLQGCGVGFEPIDGTLSGFTDPVEIEILRSQKVKGDPKGVEHNVEHSYVDNDGKEIWFIQIGDSAEAWAKVPGKILRMKKKVDKIVLDFTQIRSAGERLKGYGWISSGDETFSKALFEICNILNRRAGQLLTKIDIMDIMNWLGTTLSSRRSAEICVMPSSDPEALDFAVAKKNHYSWKWPDGSLVEFPEDCFGEAYEEFIREITEKGAYWNPQRAQSNNSLLFWEKPTKLEIKGLFQMMVDAGGSEPGFINAAAAKARGGWFKGCNPCAEILLGDKSFCNLVEVDMAKFIGDEGGLWYAIYLAARANYRQTCVNLRDGVLSDSWHELNEFLRLTGVGLTGIVKWIDGGSHKRPDIILGHCRYYAQEGVTTMADELGLPLSKATTTVKPSGTLGKIMDTSEGVHRPIAKYIINNVRFSKEDPLVPLLRDAGYRVFDDPYASDGVLAALPVVNDGVKFDEVNGLLIDNESAVSQLERYKLLMDNYVDHNCSITVSYRVEEIPEIVDWLFENWDTYVGVSWLLRQDVTKTAEDLGYPYLPQEVVSEEEFVKYVAGLKEVDIDQANSLHEMDAGGCSTGACPVR
ncbi:ribonucleoside-triphosphate reductase, adenosylcobalamin-dependent [Roseibium alexandrii]|uniref:Ribonucleoside-triphosphate reductase, adenosylcobalamin-dependent n=1 Tax=Roseibium alexandrii (strain DSM 17067 / NCIMB 14079 / DFL-11) TaxID=244592 RepID=A0A5E8GSI6_ROSAD|nr:ribonucleoside-triphosphate reductase, adenosylcobalamin-dependent [Roseibium alexandrii]EEE42840.2 ribonucleoside-triphosphate reductase, adenosylcobalamin-dependent [Roseibium alexandrii DFL-11]